MNSWRFACSSETTEAVRETHCPANNNLVEPRGLEPLTSTLPVWRSPN